MLKFFKHLKLNEQLLGFKNAEEVDDGSFIWEKSGLFEGDIMNSNIKNGIRDEDFRWSNATVPFYIEESHFNDSQVETILSAMEEFHTKSCLRFTPFKLTDVNWLHITGNESGCWSFVGMKSEGGQQLNVNSSKCVKKGVVIHELLHAAGFYHQQSAANRDDYIRINWENILRGKESNFMKYDNTHVTDYGTPYDYLSIMHYSGKAFSMNDHETISPLSQNITQLGQRNDFTDTDLSKLNQMYKSSCHSPDDLRFANIIEWFRTLFY